MSGLRLCPSARCEDGAVLLGVVGGDGLVGYLRPQLKIDAEFVREAKLGDTPEVRFRFSQPCIEGNCVQWTGKRCGFIQRVMRSAAALSTKGPVAGIPACSIRKDCRWFAEYGPSACRICPLVITETPALVEVLAHDTQDQA